MTGLVIATFSLRLEAGRRRRQVLLRQGLQHFLIAYTAADLLPSPPVKSSFVAIDSGHFYSPAFWLRLKAALLPWLPPALVR